MSGRKGYAPRTRGVFFASEGVLEEFALPRPNTDKLETENLENESAKEKADDGEVDDGLEGRISDISISTSPSSSSKISDCSKNWMG